MMWANIHSRLFKGRVLLMVGVSFLVLVSGVAHAELVVVVSVESPIHLLSREQVVNIFMGRYRHTSYGNPIEPLDIGDASLERKEFYRRLLGKSLSEINAYWARLTFAGKTAAPRRLSSAQEVLEELRRNPDAIGYMERYAIDERVKVVHALYDDRIPNF